MAFVPITSTEEVKSFGQKVKGFATQAAPAIGSTIGGIGGSIAGGVVGGPVGAYAGGVAGAGIGGAAGQAVQNKIQGQPNTPGGIAKTGAEYGALEAVAGPVFSAAGKAIEATGEGIGKMFIPKSEAEKMALQSYKINTPFLERVAGVLGYGSASAPATSASTAFDKGLMGTESMLGVQAGKAQNKIWNTIVGPALKQSTEKVNIPSFLADAEAKITAENPDPTRQEVLLNALKAIKSDFKGVTDINLEQLQKYKEGWAKFVPEKAYKGENISGALNDVRNTLAGNARTKIYDSLGDNVKQAYIDYSNLYGIKDLGIKGMGNPIKGGTGTTIKDILERVTVPAGTIGGQTIYKVGQGVELLGKPGASTVRNLLGIPLFGNDQGQSDTSPSGFLPLSNNQSTGQ